MHTTHKNKRRKTITLSKLFGQIALVLAILFGGFQANSQNHLVSAWTDLYEVNSATCVETFLCSITITTGGGTFSSVVSDIAYHPNGNLYGIVTDYFVSINLASCGATTISTHATGANSLVAAADGTLYAAGSDLYTVDPVTGVFTSLGALPCLSGGDLAFYNGELYLTCFTGVVLKVNIANPAASSVAGNLGSGNWFGFWAAHYGCDDTQMYVGSQSEIYEVDMNTVSATLSCSLGIQSSIAGGTMEGDYYASDCDLGLLDEDLSFAVFPNPTNGEIQVKMTDFVDTKVVVSDITGRQVFEQLSYGGIMNLDLHKLRQGTYFLSIITNEGQTLASEKVEIVK